MDSGVSSPTTEFHQLVSFVDKIRDNMKKGMQGVTKDALKEQAGRESRAKNIPVSANNVSYMLKSAPTGSEAKKVVGGGTGMPAKSKSSKYENWEQKIS